MAAVLLVAIFTVHLPYGFSSIKLMSVTSGRAQFGPPGYECSLLYLACLAALVYRWFGADGDRRLSQEEEVAAFRIRAQRVSSHREIFRPGV